MSRIFAPQAEPRRLQSLKELSRIKCLEMARSIYDVGSAPFYLVEPILMKMTAKQLEWVEEASPHLKHETGPVWYNLIRRDFPDRPVAPRMFSDGRAETVPVAETKAARHRFRRMARGAGAAAAPESYKALYYQYKQELEAFHTESSQRLKLATQRFQLLKPSVIEIPTHELIQRPSMTAARRPQAYGTWSMSSAIPTYSTKSPIIRKARKGVEGRHMLFKAPGSKGAGVPAPPRVADMASPYLSQLPGLLDPSATPIRSLPVAGALARTYQPTELARIVSAQTKASHAALRLPRRPMAPVTSHVPVVTHGSETAVAGPLPVVAPGAIPRKRTREPVSIFHTRKRVVEPKKAEAPKAPPPTPQPSQPSTPAIPPQPPQPRAFSPRPPQPRASLPRSPQPRASLPRPPPPRAAPPSSRILPSTFVGPSDFKRRAAPLRAPAAPSHTTFRRQPAPAARPVSAPPSLGAKGRGADPGLAVRGPSSLLRRGGRLERPGSEGSSPVPPKTTGTPEPVAMVTTFTKLKSSVFK